ncbi:MAG: flagellar export chaperone FliS [Candidatus Scalindua rubra]|uniref:Flagellar secretion chaperone FliS n=1 Tax=Candidatus Scalindua brodae TaxID=237368 RepID=A0A0B0ELD7_9BACT|nr:MAG: Flagellar protein FliS [Candidatus Scalindua brodae]MBZ0107205.1 flagellar export chaperone FliS [Candidatus Scalindua rubra]TWU31643.1 Flagellar protein FliS [Candidatus Brocadiaceae bacterium S225]
METPQTKTYKKSQVDTASPIGLVIMLYDRAIVLLNKAKIEISEKQYEAKGHTLDKATEIIFELLTTLDKDKGGEIASSLSNLYNFILREITDANSKLNSKPLDNAIRILSELRESWDRIKDNEEIVAKSRDHVINSLDISG